MKNRLAGIRNWIDSHLHPLLCLAAALLAMPMGLIFEKGFRFIVEQSFTVCTMQAAVCATIICGKRVKKYVGTGQAITGTTLKLVLIAYWMLAYFTFGILSIHDPRSNFIVFLLRAIVYFPLSALSGVYAAVLTGWAVAPAVALALFMLRHALLRLPDMQSRFPARYQALRRMGQWSVVLLFIASLALNLSGWAMPVEDDPLLLD